jgi:hypothetical protein
VPRHAVPTCEQRGEPRQLEVMSTRKRRMLGPFATTQKSLSDCGISSPSWSRLHSSCLHLQKIRQHSMIANTCIVHFVTSCFTAGRSGC